MAKRGIIGGAADAVKSMAGVALGAAAAAATTAVIEQVAKSLSKDGKGFDDAMPAIENAVKERVSKPAREITDRLLTQERSRMGKRSPSGRKPARKGRTAAAATARSAKKKKKKASPKRKATAAKKTARSKAPKARSRRTG